MNSPEVFIRIHQACFAGTGAIVRLPQCQWSKPDGYGKISQCITTTKHSKAKTVCIFIGIYCMSPEWFYIMRSAIKSDTTNNACASVSQLTSATFTEVDYEINDVIKIEVVLKRKLFYAPILCFAAISRVLRYWRCCVPATDSLDGNLNCTECFNKRS